jgi:hypothetical protein
MSETEKEVIFLIRNSNDPAAALDVALKLVLEFVEPREAAPCKTPELPSVAS